jgi:hypothetical protein
MPRYLNSEEGPTQEMGSPASHFRFRPWSLATLKLLTARSYVHSLLARLQEEEMHRPMKKKGAGNAQQAKKRPK